ncbi:hypothetical protein [Kitasatospora sp. NBC_01302]|uniref:hypothetical protein n=1 Tax=Kitasatospora sp. NBC_01302 TaxID=2903575 RepID=UPI002E102917|nr:hypothetical protein OG294_27670 [Kitasatospora sp. NBC_01302]
MTTSNEPNAPRSPSGFIGARQAALLRQIQEAAEDAANALPVRTFYPTEESAAHGVVAHFECSLDNSWTIFGDVSRNAHGLIISRMEITPAENSTGVTGGLLRKIPTGEILASVRTKAAWEAAQREGTRVLLGEEPVAGLFNDEDAKGSQRGGRARITPALLREVATAYLEETGPGVPSGAMKRMAERFGRPEETVRTWVTRARKDGWLGPGAKGRTGAEPGPRLQEWQLEELKRQHPGLISHVRVAKDGAVEDISAPQSE